VVETARISRLKLLVRRRRESYQVFFSLNAQDFDRFCGLLDVPPAANSGLERLLAVKAPWVRWWDLTELGGVLQASQSLAQVHALGAFDCGESVLIEWLKRRAFANRVTGASRTFVVVDVRNQLLAYYALAVGAVGSVRRNMPDPIPVMVLGQLAVDCP